MIKDIYAVRYYHGREVGCKFVGRCRIADGAMTPRRYDELTRAGKKAFSAEPLSHSYIRLETEDGKTTNYSGYPAQGYMYKVKFVYRRAI